MSTHHHLSMGMDPANNNSAATSSPLVSSSVQKLLSETSNGQSPLTYPPATGHYDELLHTPDLFWAKLKAFHQSFATKFVIPTVGGRALDLHRLFVEVTSRGGLEKIIRDRKWKEVIAVFNFPTTITSASFVLRKYYLSLLYHFEQVYYFQKQVPPFSMPDSLGRSPVNGSTILEEGAIQAPGPRLQIGCTVLGTIDAKFDNGYMVTVDLGSNQLKGVLYHTPPILHMSQSQRSQTPAMPTRRSQKRSRLALRDPTRPKSNRSGYNFFFAEHYTKLKPQYSGQERAISKKIGLLWNNLTEAEKEVYQEKGVRDKERYKTEMLELRTS